MCILAYTRPCVAVRTGCGVSIVSGEGGNEKVGKYGRGKQGHTLKLTMYPSGVHSCTSGRRTLGTWSISSERVPWLLCILCSACFVSQCVPGHLGV